MKKVLFILFFGSLIFAQDTLITTKGVIYSGKIIKNDSKVVEFQPSGWTSTTKFGHVRIKKLISSDGTILIENSNKPVIKSVHAKSDLSSPKRQEKDKFSFRQFGGLCIGLGGGLLAVSFIDSRDWVDDKGNFTLTLNEMNKKIDNSQLQARLGATLIAIGGLLIGFDES
tara:strand:+ start:46 stop:555 length:510 start_codon:yes stop_codon:yes gene_type:complete